jgi:hypothetical protein
VRHFALIAGAFLALMGIQNLTSNTSADLNSYLPDALSLPDWSMEFEPEQYTPDNLYEYINGEAELYNDYCFVEMITAYYVHKTDDAKAFSVDVYDMGAPLNAFGIYSSYRRPGLDFDNIGGESIMSGSNIRFYKNRYFIQVNGNSTEESMVKTTKEMAEQIAGKIQDAPPPEALSLLPESNQVEHSLTYITTGFLGQSVFGESLEAQYIIGDETCKGFVILFESNSAAQEALNEFESMLAESGSVENSAVQGTLIAEERFMGKISAQIVSGKIAGVYEYSNQSNAEKLLTSIVNSIR